MDFLFLFWKSTIVKDYVNERFLRRAAVVGRCLSDEATASWTQSLGSLVGVALLFVFLDTVIHECLPDSESGLVNSNLDDEVRNNRVESLMLNDNGGIRWDNSKLETLFSAEDRQLINQIIMSNRPLEDNLIWLPEVIGDFSVRSAYRLSTGDAGNSRIGEEKFWKWLWQYEIPGKCKVLLWRAMRNWLPTRDALRAKRCDIADVCLLCEAHLESVPHFFVNYVFVNRCWLLVGVNSITHPWQSLLDFLNWIFTGKNEDFKLLIVMVLWSVWHAWNNLLWNETKEHLKASGESS
ncbi:uncharacterized protein LOC126673028 [Mercurialis annua]|uniref:uncharacterized protein LOC126673028 n=1 Tax=Mercurialis annua TaxID=3986 RepID=UPI00215FAD25|nr:uncharacterized protein LOC126673028 [Mercurialis annua]